MKIKNLKINGITDPVGFDLDDMYISYYIDGEPDGILTADIFDENGEKVFSKTLDYAENYHTKIDFKPKKQSEYTLAVSCGEERAEARFETGTDFACEFITPEKHFSHPIIFKAFSCKNVKKARLYITGLGLYEATINGKKVGNEYLTPYCNDYCEYVQYQTFDVTKLLKGENLLEIALGDGWYKGRFGLRHKSNIYGSEYVCACKIVIWDENGSHTITSDESFKAKRSHTVSSGIYDGETIDDTITDDEIFNVKQATLQYNPVERISLPIVVKHKLKPQLLISHKGEKILDFGQNFSGFVSFENFLKKNEKITLKACEILDDGCFFRDNLRSAKAEFTYISDGIKKNVAPKFTFFGFRYMLVEYKGDINPELFTGNVIYSDLDSTVYARTDSDKINRLIQNCVWGQRSNFVDVPTDCPQRDERLGWTGDAEVFSATACYQMDCRAFYKKYMRDISVEQNYLDGDIPTYAPGFGECEAATSVWADAATIIPWTVYMHYGDKTILEQSYHVMKRYIDKLKSLDDEHGANRLYNFGFHLGDWLSQDGVSSTALKAGTNEYFLASCYYYESVKILSQTAGALGKEEEEKYYGQLARDIKSAILKEYFTASGRCAIDTQTAYVICVSFGIYSDWHRLCESFRKRMKKDCYVIKGGFVGATKLVQALFKCGLDEIAFRVLYNEKFPGWLYCVNLGATTIWERWNSLNPDGSLCDPTMNSFNHYAFGAVAESIYKNIAGIYAEDIAFKKVVLRPKFNFRLKKFDYKFVSASGEFAVKYTISGKGEVKYSVKIPYGVEAKIETEELEQPLVCGTDEFTFKADRKLVHPFSVDSALCDILGNDKASEVYKQIVPGQYYYFTHNVIGMEGFSLRDLSKLSSFHLPDEKFAELDEELKSIRI